MTVTQSYYMKNYVDTSLFRVHVNLNHWEELMLKNQQDMILEEYCKQFNHKFEHADWRVGKILVVYFERFNLVDLIFLPIGVHWFEKVTVQEIGNWTNNR